MPIWTGVAKALIRTGVAGRIPAIRQLMGEGLPFLKYYNGRILGSPNVELRATQALLDAATGDVIDLSVGAPEVDPQIDPRAAIGERVASGYPAVAGLPELRSAIADKLQSENGIHVDPQWEVLVTNGVSQGIGLMLDTFVDRGEKVAILDPGFFVYRLAAMNRGCKVHLLPTETAGGKMCIADRDLERGLRRAKVLFLNTPNNPTGGIAERDVLERIAYWCKRRDVLVFSDEVYERFVYRGEHVSIGSLPGMADRTITANSFSKTHALASFRAGYLAGPRYLIQPTIVSFLATAPFVSTASQRMALAALARPTTRLDAMIDRFRRRRRLVADTLRRLGLPADEPPGAFYFWTPIGSLGCTAAEFSSRLLAEQRVVVMPGDSYGIDGTRHIRISYALAETQLIEGLRRLESFVQGDDSLPLPVPLAGRKAA